MKQPDDREPSTTRNLVVLLTDLEGSTRLWEAAPDAMSRAMKRHDELILRAVASHKGRLLRARGEGDSAFAVFDDVESAARCALAIQRAFRSEQWPHPAVLRIRIGLDSGPVETRGDYYGPVVNRCARMRSSSSGGQVVCSEAVRNALSTGGSITVTELGLHRFKDLGRPQRVFQLDEAGVPGTFPPLRSLDDSGHNLPVQLTSFIGRDADIDEVLKLLASARLVTLTGEGGVGKTRLAMQVAAELARDCPDGVWFADLSAIADEAQLDGVVGSVLGVQEEPGRPLRETIADHLASRRLLLVLDNCEQIVEACAHLAAQLMSASSDLQILATSREPLRVYGELVHRVPPMTVPRADVADEANRSDSERLFFERASLVSRNLDVEQSAPHVREICRMLDGVPLAIELAAARADRATPEQIVGQLHDALAVLSDGPRTVPERQRSVRAALDWSFEQLDTHERAVFCALGVFAGSWTVEAATSVCDSAVGTVVERLVERSLVREDDAGEQPRFRLLETVRAYAVEKLGTLGRADDVRSRLVAWGSELARWYTAGLMNAEVLQTMGLEEPNVRAALTIAMTRGDQEAVWQMTHAILSFVDARSRWSEGLVLADEVLPVLGPGVLRGRILTQRGGLSTVRGDMAAAKASHEEAVEIARATGTRDLECHALGNLATVYGMTGDPLAAKPLMEEALEIARETGDRQSERLLEDNLGLVAAMLGDRQGAVIAAERAVERDREDGTPHHLAFSLANLAIMYLSGGDWARARAAADEALRGGIEVEDPYVVTRAHGILGSLSELEGDAEDAEIHATLARKMAEEIGAKVEIGEAEILLASIAELRGQLADALTHTAAARAIATEVGSDAMLARAEECDASAFLQAGALDDAAAACARARELFDIEGDDARIAYHASILGRISVARGDAEVGAALIAAARALRESRGAAVGLPQHASEDAASAGALRRLGDPAFRKAVERGRAAPADEIIDLCREVTGPSRPTRGQ